MQPILPGDQDAAYRFSDVKTVQLAKLYECETLQKERESSSISHHENSRRCISHRLSE